MSNRGNKWGLNENAKPKALGRSRCDTIKNPPYSEAVDADDRPTFCSISYLRMLWRIQEFQNQGDAVPAR